jgi:hypothetical protein
VTTPARPWRIDTVLGPRTAAEAVRALAEQYRRHDLLDEAAAFRTACELMASGSPWLLVRPGQIWELGDRYFPTAEMPRRVRIMAVGRPCAQHPMRIRFADLDACPWQGAGYLRVDDLEACYALTSWPNPPARTEPTT